MTPKIEAEIKQIHKDIEEMKEELDIVVESYIEMMHEILEKDKGKFISLNEHSEKHDI
jgi:hypothetical protein